MHNFVKAAFVSLLVLGAMLCRPAAAGTMTPEQKTEIEDIVRNYLLEHPEILRDMSQKLEANERLAEEEARNKALTQHAATLFKSTADPVVGNPNGDVTLVEFMDYNCGYCKKSFSEITALIEKDKNLRVVMKEFPILSPGSEYAAKAALAAVRQGKYWDLHRALFAHNGPVTAEVTDQLAESLGLDMAKLKADMGDPQITSAIQANHALAQALLINGTPAFIVDKAVLPGYVAADVIASAVQDVRTAGGCSIC